MMDIEYEFREKIIDIKHEFREKIKDYKSWEMCDEGYLYGQKYQSKHGHHYYYKFNPDFQLYLLDCPKLSSFPEWYTNKENRKDDEKQLLQTNILLRYRTVIVDYIYANYYYPEPIIIPLPLYDNIITKNSVKYCVGNIFNNNQFERCIDSHSDINITITD